MKKFTNYNVDNINHRINNKLECKNYIMYCHNHLYNYRNVISLLTQISPSKLKYSRKFMLDDKYFNMSDVHIEIDFEILGVNEYNIFFDVFSHIQENVLHNKNIIYIVCLHFNNVKKELQDVFYNFFDKNKISFILCTNKYSFLCDHIKDNSILCKIPVKESSEYNKKYTSCCNNIILYITKKQKLNLFKLRETIYELLIKNYNIHDSLEFIIFQLVELGYINDNTINTVFKQYKNIIEKYNNNYRAIYHIERFIVFLINLKNNDDL
jgi:hypothetical protein